MSVVLSVSITIILVVVAYIILNRNINARTSQQAALEEIKREVGAILTELNATSERNVVLLEDKIQTLTDLIDQADRRITVLRRESEPRGEIIYRRPPHRQAISEGSRLEPTEPLVSPPEAKGSPQPASGPEPTENEPLHDRVRRLYLQGFPVQRIAAIVGRTLGEVELIIALEEGSEA